MSPGADGVTRGGGRKRRGFRPRGVPAAAEASAVAGVPLHGPPPSKSPERRPRHEHGSGRSAAARGWGKPVLFVVGQAPAGRAESKRSRAGGKKSERGRSLQSSRVEEESQVSGEE